MTPENLSRAFAVLGSHGLAVNGAELTIVDRAALEAYSKPDVVPEELF